MSVDNRTSNQTSALKRNKMFLARVEWLPLTFRSHTRTHKCKISIMIILYDHHNLTITIPDHPHPPEVNVTSNLSSNSVTVNLDWIEEDGVSYNVSVTPPLMIRQVCSTCVELTVLYNIVYNVSVLSTLCGCNTAATVIKLIYSKWTN